MTIVPEGSSQHVGAARIFYRMTNVLRTDKAHTCHGIEDAAFPELHADPSSANYRGDVLTFCHSVFIGDRGLNGARGRVANDLMTN